uniref:Collagen type VI alpha 6 chain n=1 Tax=Pelusios castaneus TaxID=367368 RepID=A0A8C8RQS1_9SAUR
PRGWEISAPLLLAVAGSMAEILPGFLDAGVLADIYVLIDGSTSIHPTDFGDIKNFLKEVIKMFNIGLNKVRFGAVQYSHFIEQEFELNDHTKSVDLENAIDNIRQIYGNTYIGAALTFMQPLFKKAREQRAVRVPCHLIVLTDGESHDSVKEPAETLRNEQINIYSIGVKGANERQLHEISGSKSRTYFVHEFDSLKDIKNGIVQRICIFVWFESEHQSTGFPSSFYFSQPCNKQDGFQLKRLPNPTTPQTAPIHPHSSVYLGQPKIFAPIHPLHPPPPPEQPAPVKPISLFSIYGSGYTNTPISSSIACKEMKADVMFLVDSSGSIGDDNFLKMKSFMREVVNKSDIGVDRVQVGVVQFSGTNKEEFQLDQYSSKSDIFSAIERMSLMGQNTLMGSALTFVSDYFKPSKGARPGVKKFLILITDGEAQDEVVNPAAALRKQDVVIYSVGVTEANKAQLEEISGKRELVFYVSTFDILKHLEDQIIFGICSPYEGNFVGTVFKSFNLDSRSGSNPV